MADLHEAVLREMAEHYKMPLRDSSQPRPQLHRPSRAASLAFSASRIAKQRRKRRLAVLDSTFPWRMSGFRYHEATAILQARPDTLFFSTYEMSDPFPVSVHRLPDFPEIAMREGVTDAYGVFLWFLAGLVGLGPSRDGSVPHPMEGLDISHALATQRIRLHGSLLPGGGLVATEESYAWAEQVIERLDTAFSFSDDVLDRFPEVARVPAAFTETRFYAASSERWSDLDPLVCLFAADAPPRKGVDVAIETFSGLADGFHLHVAGPHEDRRSQLPVAKATFHGWLEAPALRDLHQRTHVFLSPVSAEAPSAPGGGGGMTDGFPTQAAVDAMSSGCLLVSANPLGDHRVFEPGAHYVECAADPTTLRDRLRDLAKDPRAMRRIADAGAARVRECMDVRLGVEAKLARIGL